MVQRQLKEHLIQKIIQIFHMLIRDSFPFDAHLEILKISEDAAKNNYSHGIKSLQKIMGKKR